MNGWGVQWKRYVPGRSNVRRQVTPGAIGPESHAPSSAVTVCGSWSRLVQATVPPAPISTRFGAKASCRIATATCGAAESGTAAAAETGGGAWGEYRLSVKGGVNSKPPRTLAVPRDAPCRVAGLVFAACRGGEDG